jgi:hypothetical protein
MKYICLYRQKKYYSNNILLQVCDNTFCLYLYSYIINPKMYALGKITTLIGIKSTTHNITTAHSNNYYI